MNCPACGSEGISLFTRENQPASVHINSANRKDMEIEGCEKCEFIWNKYAFNESEAFNNWISEAYNSYELLSNDLHRFPLVDKRAETCRNFIIENIKPDEFENVVEIGSNRGDFLAYLKSEFSNIQVLGIESTKFITTGVQTIFDDSRNVHLSASYNLVIIRQVLEHIPNPVPFLKHISTYLKENGYVLIEVPDLENDLAEGNDPWVMEHVGHYSVNSLIKIAQKAGLAPVSINREEQLLGLFTNGSTGMKEVNNGKGNRFAQVESFGLRKEDCKKEWVNLHNNGYEFCFYGASNIYLSISSELQQTQREFWESCTKTLLDDYEKKQSQSVNGLVVHLLNNFIPKTKCVYIICAMNRDHHKKMFENLKSRLGPDDQVYIMWKSILPNPNKIRG